MKLSSDWQARKTPNKNAGSNCNGTGESGAMNFPEVNVYKT